MAGLKRALGDLDRVTAWLRIVGMVNAAPGFHDEPAVINGCSDLILDLYGPVSGQHARSAVGLAELPWNMPVEIEAEAAIRPESTSRSTIAAATEAEIGSDSIPLTTIATATEAVIRP